MRIGAYLLLEMTLAGLLLGVGGWQAVRGLMVLQHSWAGWSALRQPDREVKVPTREELPAVRDDLRLALEASGTFLGMSDDLLLTRMRTQPPTRFKLNRGGSSLSFRVDFADGSRGAFKPLQTN